MRALINVPLGPCQHGAGIALQQDFSVNDDFQLLAIAECVANGARHVEDVAGEIKEDGLFVHVQSQSVFSGFWCGDITLAKLHTGVSFTGETLTARITDRHQANDLLTVQFGPFGWRQTVSDELRILEGFQNLDLDQTANHGGKGVNVQKCSWIDADTGAFQQVATLAQSASTLERGEVSPLTLVANITP